MDSLIFQGCAKGILWDSFGIPLVCQRNANGKCAKNLGFSGGWLVSRGQGAPGGGRDAERRAPTLSCFLFLYITPPLSLLSLGFLTCAGGETSEGGRHSSGKEESHQAGLRVGY